MAKNMGKGYQQALLESATNLSKCSSKFSYSKEGSLLTFSSSALLSNISPRYARWNIESSPNMTLAIIT